MSRSPIYVPRPTKHEVEGARRRGSWWAGASRETFSDTLRKRQDEDGAAVQQYIKAYGVQRMPSRRAPVRPGGCRVWCQR